MVPKLVEIVLTLRQGTPVDDAIKALDQELASLAKDGPTLEEIERAFGPVPVRISAQAHLSRFYRSFGFREVSERYLEDDVPHVAMLRA